MPRFVRGVVGVSGDAGATVTDETVGSLAAPSLSTATTDRPTLPALAYVCVAGGSAGPVEDVVDGAVALPVDAVLELPGFVGR